MHLYKRTNQTPTRDEQVSDGICAHLTGSENWFDNFFLINFFWPYLFYFTTDYDQS